MIPSLEGWPTKAKEAPSPHEVRLTPLETNPVFQCLGGKSNNTHIFRESIPNTTDLIFFERSLEIRSFLVKSGETYKLAF